MSLDLMTRVWGMGIPSTAKMVLLSLADQAKDNGVCWPSQPQIARRCSLTERAVRSQLLWLEGVGYLHRSVKAGVGTTFVLTLPETEEPRNDVPPRKDIPPRNQLPATPEQYSGNPGTTFRQTVSKRNEPSVEGGKPPAADTGKKPSAMKGSRLAADWQLPKAWGEWAMQEVPTWSEEQIRRVGLRFGDYWRAKAGRDAIKTDWQATWRNWVRTEVERVGATPARIQSSDAHDPFRGCL